MPTKSNVTRADGRVAVTIYLGRDENNKRKYKTVYGAIHKEAEAKAKLIRTAMKKGSNITADAKTFGDWAEIWIAQKETEVSNGQFNACKSAKKYLVESLGDILITKVRAADIQAVITALAKMNPYTKKPSSVKTLKSVNNAASQIMLAAIYNRVIDFNPADAVRIPKFTEPGKKRSLTEEEQMWVNALEHNAKRAAMIMLYSGLRRGELIPLTWNDIDLNAKTISVNKAVEVKNNQFIVKPTAKTSKSLRIVDIPIELVNFLKTESRESVVVCPNTMGKMHSDTSWTRMWNSYLLDMNIKFGDFGTLRKKNGNPYTSKFDPEGTPFVIPRITSSWLRHTFATSLYFAGVDVLTARDQLGHSNIKTTLEIYTHLDSIFKRRSMDKLDVFYASKKGNAGHDASQN